MTVVDVDVDFDVEVVGGGFCVGRWVVEVVFFVLVLLGSLFDGLDGGIEEFCCGGLPVE